MAKLKVIAACGSGMGSSQIIKMKLEKAFKKLGIDADGPWRVVEKDFQSGYADDLHIVLRIYR